MSTASPDSTVHLKNIESSVLARELGGAFGRLVKYFREEYALSPDEARKRAQEGCHQSGELVRRKPPDQVSWHDLSDLAESDPDLAQQRWEEVKEAALDEVRSGHRAATVMEPQGPQCWSRAK